MKTCKVSLLTLSNTSIPGNSNKVKARLSSLYPTMHVKKSDIERFLDHYPLIVYKHEYVKEDKICEALAKNIVRQKLWRFEEHDIARALDYEGASYEVLILSGGFNKIKQSGYSTTTTILLGLINYYRDYLLKLSTHKQLNEHLYG